MERRVLLRAGAGSAAGVSTLLLPAAAAAASGAGVLATGALDTSLPDLNINDIVRAVLPQADGGIIIGGQFLSVNAVARSRLARIAPDGTLDEAWCPQGADGIVHALAYDSSGRILVGGEFSTLAGGTRSRLGRLLADGTLDTTFADPELRRSSAATVNAVAEQPGSGGKLVVMGVFTDVGPSGAAYGTDYENVVRLAADGSVDTTFPATTLNGNGFAVDFQRTGANAGRIILGGYFTSVTQGGPAQIRSRVCALDSDGNLIAGDKTTGEGFDYNFTGDGITNSVFRLVVDSEDRVLVGGSFPAKPALGIRGALTRLNADGTPDPDFADPQVLNSSLTTGSVLAIALTADDRIYIGGFFATVSGTGRSRLARITTSGVLDGDFGDVVADANVMALAIDSVGRVVAGGQFTTLTVSGTSYRRLARFS